MLHSKTLKTLVIWVLLRCSCKTFRHPQNSIMNSGNTCRSCGPNDNMPCLSHTKELLTLLPFYITIQGAWLTIVPSPSCHLFSAMHSAWKKSHWLVVQCPVAHGGMHSPSRQTWMPHHRLVSTWSSNLLSWISANHLIYTWWVTALDWCWLNRSNHVEPIIYKRVFLHLRIIGADAHKRVDSRTIRRLHMWKNPSYKDQTFN